MNNSKLVVFDFDGTIANTMPGIADSYNIHAPAYNLPLVAPEDYDRIRSKGAANFMKSLGLSPLKLLRFIQLVQHDMRANMANIEPFAGMPEALRELHEFFQLAIVTSNQADIVDAFLQRHNLSELFSEIRCEKNYFGKAKVIKKVVRSFDPNVQAVYIGDEERDIIAAMDSGIPGVAVTWGFDMEPALQAAAPLALAHTPKELVTIIKLHLG